MATLYYIFHIKKKKNKKKKHWKILYFTEFTSPLFSPLLPSINLSKITEKIHSLKSILYGKYKHWNERNKKKKKTRDATVDENWERSWRRRPDHGGKETLPAAATVADGGGRRSVSPPKSEIPFCCCRSWILWTLSFYNGALFHVFN